LNANPRTLALEWPLQSLAAMPNLKAMVGALAALAAVDGAPAHGESAAVPLVFGVDIGASADDLSTVLQASGVACQRAQQDAVICPTGLTALSNQPGTTTTFWIANGRVSRIYQVGDMASLGLASYAALATLFRERQMHIQGFLGDVPARQTGREPSWIASLDDASKLGWLRAGMFWREVVWENGGRKVSLTLRGEKGKVLLVLGLEPMAQAAQALQAPAGAQPSRAPAPRWRRG